MRVFVAGATGAIGRVLVPALVQAGHEVTGMTRTEQKAAAIEATGAAPLLCDVLDRDALSRAVKLAAPEVVVHELTELPPRYREFAKGLEATNHLRTVGTQNLVEAAVAAGAHRAVAQSIAFLYAPEARETRSRTSKVVPGTTPQPLSATPSVRCSNWSAR